MKYKIGTIVRGFNVSNMNAPHHEYVIVGRLPIGNSASYQIKYLTGPELSPTHYWLKEKEIGVSNEFWHSEIFQPEEENVS